MTSEIIEHYAGVVKDVLDDDICWTVVRPRSGRAEREQRRTARRQLTHLAPARLLPGVALDRKACRGARTGDGGRIFLVGAISHGQGVILGQCQVAGKRDEGPAARTLLERLDLARMVLTLDALRGKLKGVGGLDEARTRAGCLTDVPVDGLEDVCATVAGNPVVGLVQHHESGSCAFQAMAGAGDRLDTTGAAGAELNPLLADLDVVLLLGGGVGEHSAHYISGVRGLVDRGSGDLDEGQAHGLAHRIALLVEVGEPAGADELDDGQRSQDGSFPHPFNLRRQAVSYNHFPRSSIAYSHRMKRFCSGRLSQPGDQHRPLGRPGQHRPCPP